MAVEPSLCPSIFQDLAESGALEPEAAPVSNVHIRVVRALKFCSSREISKCFCDMRNHSGHPIRNRRNLRDLRFKVYKFREESIELFIRCTPRAGAHTIEVGTRAITRTKIRRSNVHG